MVKRDGLRKKRLWFQVCFMLLTNSYLVGFLQGKIFTGSTKSFCVPGLNCYSCPGALGSCPIGSLQAVLGSRSYNVSFYVLGFFLLVGSFLGRFICGWLCPFGLFQDLLDRIRCEKKRSHLPGDAYIKWLRYVALFGFVILLPIYAVDMLGQGQPWFCKYLCPSGTLMAGLPLVLVNKSLQTAIGWLFAWKSLLLFLIILLSLVVYRPFCRYLCPLGLIYGWFNRVAFYRYALDKGKCTSCGVCQKACKLNIAVYEQMNTSACIRCGHCITACPNKALTIAFGQTVGKDKAGESCAR